MIKIYLIWNTIQITIKLLIWSFIIFFFMNYISVLFKSLLISLTYLLWVFISLGSLYILISSNKSIPARMLYSLRGDT